MKQKVETKRLLWCRFIKPGFFSSPPLKDALLWWANGPLQLSFFLVFEPWREVTSYRLMRSADLQFLLIHRLQVSVCAAQLMQTRARTINAVARRVCDRPWFDNWQSDSGMLLNLTKINQGTNQHINWIIIWSRVNTTWRNSMPYRSNLNLLFNKRHI